MRQLTCSSCGSAFPAGTMFRVDNAAVCEPCGDRLVGEAKAKRQKISVAHLLDPTVCSRCKTDYGNTDLPLVAGTPICDTCRPALYAHPFAGWLKASTAALLLLLGFALWRGAPYFTAGRQLVLARRAMERSDYQTASTHFAAVLPVKPTNQRVVLLGAKAALMAGDPATAYAFLELRSEFEKNDLFSEVKTLWDHAEDAVKKSDSAAALAKAHNNVDAARLMKEASTEYPQSKPLAVAAMTLSGYVAWDRKDYDGMVQNSRQALALAPDDPGLIAAVASAIACKYAVTGDTTFRVESERLLAQAATRAATADSETKANVADYVERIRYRLSSRVIIDKEEYDRRFPKHRAVN